MQKNKINTKGIKKILPHGAIKMIASRANVTVFTVSRVVNGTSNSPKVLMAIKDYIEEIKEIDNGLNSLIAESQTA
jgi:hypothetical protein